MEFFKKKTTAPVQIPEMTDIQKKLVSALRTLKDAGILTEDEYHEKKRKVLEMK